MEMLFNIDVSNSEDYSSMKRTFLRKEQQVMVAIEIPDLNLFPTRISFAYIDR